jgi:hypothetical protein
MVFSGSSTESTQVNVNRQALINTNADRSVSVSVRGKLVADDEFKSYQIVVGPNSRSITVYHGYLDKAINSVTLSNNIPAYEQFVYALDKAGMMSGPEIAADSNDTRGVCATGLLYEFNILKDNKSEKQVWTSNCSGVRGSLGTSVGSILNLFKSQIPDSEKITGSI